MSAMQTPAWSGRLASLDRVGRWPSSDALRAEQGRAGGKGTDGPEPKSITAG